MLPLKNWGNSYWLFASVHVTQPAPTPWFLHHIVNYAICLPPNPNSRMVLKLPRMSSDTITQDSVYYQAPAVQDGHCMSSDTITQDSVYYQAPAVQDGHCTLDCGVPLLSHLRNTSWLLSQRVHVQAIGLHCLADPGSFSCV